MRKRRLLPPPAVPNGPSRVLIISASMGAGHDSAARSLAAQLRAHGHVADVADFLHSGPLHIGAALRRGYELELKHIPSAYDATYRFWYRAPWLRPLLAWLVTFLTRRRVLRWIAEMHPHVVVSTYPLSTLCLGSLRRSGRLQIPAVNFITDFGVHPLWVHPGIDLNVAINDVPAADAHRRTGRPTVACGPAVSARFDTDALPPRLESRARFGIPAKARAVLIVAGSWGVGDLVSTWKAVAACGDFVPVVVCGRDERLRRQIESITTGSDSVVLGWTDDMPALMSACDALVENAGGMTSLEAMAVGLPVVSFEPIAGHGKANTAAMDAAGVARLAPDATALRSALGAVTAAGPERDAQVARAYSMFRGSPAEAVLSAKPVSGSVLRRHLSTPLRLLAGVTALAGMAWAGLTSGVAMATEAGAGVAHPAKGSGPVAYVGLRLTTAELDDPMIRSDVERLHATVVLDQATAEAAAPAVRTLVTLGVTVASGGAGKSASDTDLPWKRAEIDAKSSRVISSLLHMPVTKSVPGRRLTAWDLVACRDLHTSLVVPNHILDVERWSADTIGLKARDIYLVNGLGATPAQTADFLSLLQVSLDTQLLLPQPLSTLA